MKLKGRDKVGIFFIFILLAGCNKEYPNWKVEKIEELGMVFFYPPDFEIGDIDEIPIEHVPISEGEKRIIFCNLQKCKFIYLTYENKANWVEGYHYETAAATRKFFYENTSDSIKIIKENTIYINKNKFNRIQILSYSIINNKSYCAMDIAGRTQNGYDVSIRYKVPVDGKNIDEIITESENIIKKMYFY
ncbi:MAG: hypothetical protein R3E32_09335 [Chitinophagales bacterium]